MSPARLDVEPAQGVEHGDAGAQQRRRIKRTQSVRDSDQAGGAGIGHLGVPAVLSRAGLWLVLAVHKFPAPAPVTFATMAAKEAQTDTLASSRSHFLYRNSTISARPVTN